MANKLYLGNQTISAPYMKAFAITPNDGTDLPTNTRAIYVGGAGNVAAILEGDTASVTFTAPPVGSILPIAAKRVLSTGTTATLLIALV